MIVMYNMVKMLERGDFYEKNTVDINSNYTVVCNGGVFVDAFGC